MSDRGSAQVVLLLVAVMAPVQVVTSQPASGDWIIDSLLFIEDRSIQLDGNLIVRADGDLTLRGVDLAFAASPSGPYGIVVEPGGSLTVIGGSVRPAEPSSHITFVARGDQLSVDGVELTGIGLCHATAISCANEAPEQAGIVIGTPGAVIKESHITNGGVALIIQANDVQVTGNTIEHNDRCAIYVLGDRAIIKDNVLRQSYHGFLGNTCIIQMEGADDVAIIGNDLREDPFPPGVGGDADPQGINTHDSNGILIEDNTIAAYRPVHLFEVSNTRVINNTIHAGEVGVFLQGGANNRVEGNTIFGDGWHDGTGPTNTLALGVQQGSVVADNRLVMHRGLGYDVIVLNQFFDGQVLNNVIEASFDAYEEDPNLAEGAEALILMHSSGNEVRGNRLGIAWGGLLLLGSDSNVIEGNEIRGLRGIMAMASNGNTIVGNNILDAPRGSFDDGSNTWAGKTGGNHWLADPNSQEPRLIPPHGTDRAPRKEPVEVQRWPVRAYEALPPDVAPQKRDSLVLETSVLENQVMEITHGSIRPPFGESRLVIRNSTLTLGRLGPAGIGAEHVEIESSRLIMATPGYGFSFDANGDRFIVRNSRIEGGSWADPAPREFVLENSTVTNTVAIGIFSSARAIETVRIVNNTFAGLLIPLYVGAVESAIVTGNRFMGSMRTAILVNDIPPTYKDRMREIVVSANEVHRVWKDPAIVVGYNDVELERAVVSRNYVGDSLMGFTGGGKGLVVTLNTFCENRQVQAGGSPDTRWHDGGLGNYWSNYVGADADGDGIGDTPYEAEGTVDPFPLMEAVTTVACGSPRDTAGGQPSERNLAGANASGHNDPDSNGTQGHSTPAVSLVGALMVLVSAVVNRWRIRR